VYSCVHIPDSLSIQNTILTGQRHHIKFPIRKISRHQLTANILRSNFILYVKYFTIYVVRHVKINAKIYFNVLFSRLSSEQYSWFWNTVNLLIVYLIGDLQFTRYLEVYSIVLLNHNVLLQFRKKKLLYNILGVWIARVLYSVVPLELWTIEFGFWTLCLSRLC